MRSTTVWASRDREKPKIKIWAGRGRRYLSCRVPWRGLEPPWKIQHTGPEPTTKENKMGAELFTEVAWGKSPRDAFNRAKEDAQYFHGHGGYTGTIAEKTDYTLCNPPSEVRIHDAIHYVECVAGGDLKKIPEAFRDWAVKTHAIHDEKWGPAVCIHLAEEEAEDFYCPSGEAEGNPYLFMGWASS